MASEPFKGDCYGILGVQQSASRKDIHGAYKNLATRFIAKKNKGANATQAFHQLGQAHGLLTDEMRRREYDKIYHTIPREVSFVESTLINRRSSSVPKTPAPLVAIPLTDQISELEQCLYARTRQWHAEKKLFRNVYLRATSDIYTLKSELIDLLADREALSWEEIYDDNLGRMTSAWQEKKRQNHIMWRQLLAQERELQKAEKLHELDRQEAHAAIRRYEVQITGIAHVLWAKEEENRREKEAKEQKEREDAEDQQRALIGPNSANWRIWATEKGSEEEEAGEEASEASEETVKQEPRSTNEIGVKIRKLRDQMIKVKQEMKTAEADCSHVGWWAKVEGEASCPYCKEVWRYLLECPHCPTRACPRCQVVFRSAQHDD